MRERPILFSAPMVRAIISGAKSVTRRLLKLQPGSGVVPHATTVGTWNWTIPATGVGTGVPFCCPYGVAGDRLWVRERMRVLDFRHSDQGPCVRVRYEADGIESGWVDYPDRLAPAVVGKCLAYGGHREASRITLEVVSVRVERLQALGLDDVFAELGMTKKWAAENKSESWEPYDAFAELWDSINGKRGPWAANPWVWRVEFRRLVP